MCRNNCSPRCTVYSITWPEAKQRHLSQKDGFVASDMLLLIPFLFSELQRISLDVFFSFPKIYCIMNIHNKAYGTLKIVQECNMSRKYLRKKSLFYQTFFVIMYI